MARFSGTAAVTAGWRIVAREPVAFAAWCLVYFALVVLPQVVVVSRALPAFFEMLRGLGPGKQPSMEQILRFDQEAIGTQPLPLLATVVFSGLIACAIFRAVLTPQDRKGFYLRAGGQELWVSLVVVALMALYGAGVALAVIVASTVGVAALLLVGMAILLWALLRLSLALPATFEQHKFRLFQSWKMTRGHALKMAAVAAFLVATLVVLEMAIVTAGVAAVGGPERFAELVGVWSTNPQAAFENVTPISWAGLAVVATVFGTFTQALLYGAWAEIYRGLSGPTPEPTSVWRPV